MNKRVKSRRTNLMKSSLSNKSQRKNKNSKNQNKIIKIKIRTKIKSKIKIKIKKAKLKIKVKQKKVRNSRNKMKQRMNRNKRMLKVNHQAKRNQPRSTYNQNWLEKGQSRNNKNIVKGYYFSHSSMAQYLSQWLWS